MQKIETRSSCIHFSNGLVEWNYSVGKKEKSKKRIERKKKLINWYKQRLHGR